MSVRGGRNRNLIRHDSFISTPCLKQLFTPRSMLEYFVNTNHCILGLHYVELDQQRYCWADFVVDELCVNLNTSVGNSLLEGCG